MARSFVFVIFRESPSSLFFLFFGPNRLACIFGCYNIGVLGLILSSCFSSIILAIRVILELLAAESVANSLLSALCNCSFYMLRGAKDWLFLRASSVLTFGSESYLSDLTLSLESESCFSTLISF